MLVVMKTITAELLEDPAKRGEGGRRLTGRERIATLLAQYDASGLSMAAFARREGLKYPTFAGWVKKRAGQTAPTSPTAPRSASPMAVRFAEVRLPPLGGEAAGLSVTLPDGLVLRGNDPVTLAALTRALGPRC